MSPRSTLLPFAAAFFLGVHATQWNVGAGETHTAPSQVASLVADGDTVNIAAGVYPSDVTNWTANDLLLRGVGGMAHLESNGNAWGEKAIWVIQGDRTTVEWIEFSECSVPDMNGAGIRQEGHHLTVRNCYFHMNQNGILAGAISPCTILIEHSEFGYNGAGDGYSHNLYIGHVDSLIFRYNYSHHTYAGHELKSRAHVNMILYNRLSNELDGEASREIDLPNGGPAYIIGNVLHQGQQGQNSNMIGYGLEGLSNPGPQALYAINNTLVNQRSAGSFFSMGSATSFKAYNNIMAGQGQFASTFPAQVDTAGNLKQPVIALVGFADVSNYDYHIDNSSPAHNIGIPAGLSSNGFPLVAWDEYVHPLGSTVRCQHALLDAGAFETCTTGINEGTGPHFALWPNPARDHVMVTTTAGARIELLDVGGRLLLSTIAQGNTHELDLGGLAAGGYLVRVSGQRPQRFIIP
jgi:hypothetical protein